MRCNEECDQVEIIIDDQYESIIQSLWLSPRSIKSFIISFFCVKRMLLNSFIDEYPLDMTNKDIKDSFFPMYSPFLKKSIINEQQYDAYLKEWIGSEYTWKLLYRALEHGYTAKSFHEYCDDHEPTLVLIKSLKGWIFGGYTTQSWKTMYSILFESIYYEIEN